MGTLLSQQLPAEPASLPRIRHAATAALAKTGITDRGLLGAIELARSEAVTNSINHAYPSTDHLQHLGGTERCQLLVELVELVRLEAERRGLWALDDQLVELLPALGEHLEWC